MKRKRIKEKRSTCFLILESFEKKRQEHRDKLEAVTFIILREQILCASQDSTHELGRRLSTMKRFPNSSNSSQAIFINMQNSFFFYRALSCRDQ